MTDIALSAEVAASQARWREARRYLNEHRHELSQWAARHLYAGHLRVGATDLLTSPDWMPAVPIPLEAVSLAWTDTAPAPQIDGTEPETAHVRPLRNETQRFSTYAAAVGELAKPGLFEDRPCYRLTDVALDDGRAELTFGTATYFDVINVCEAVAHELADSALGSGGGVASPTDLQFRARMEDPCDPLKRRIVPAISALTVRRTPTDAAFVLHRRDSRQVAHGGGLYQVMPVGVFQPTGAEPGHRSDDFDLWRCIAREYSEEFLGMPELRGPIDYDDWPFYRKLTAARAAGEVTAHLLGIGIDPLSAVCDLLVVVVFDSDTFDVLLGESVHTNAEGQLVTEQAGQSTVAGVPFTGDATSRLITEAPMQAAGAALLDLAWHHRSALHLVD
jgi:hypothetical protein